MKAQNVLAMAMLAVAAFSCVSCRAAVEGSGLSGDASVTVKLAGLLAPAPSRDASSRILFPLTDRVEITVSRPAASPTGNAVVVFSGAFALSPSAPAVTIDGLPDGEPLAISAIASYNGTTLSTGSAGTTLVAGSNEVGITLECAIAKQGEMLMTDGTVKASLLVNSTLPAGELFWCSLLIPESAVDSAFQIICATGTARPMWMKVYDTDWNPAACIYSAEGEGWSLLKASAGTKGSTQSGYYCFRVLVCNNQTAPGYRATDPASATLEIRPAAFVTTAGSGANKGTIEEPATIATIANTVNGYSYFFMQGDYDVASTPVTLASDVRFYGGFGSGFSTRAVTSGGICSTKILSTASTPLYIMYVQGSGCLDGFDVTAPSYGGTTMTPVYALTLSFPSATSGFFSVKDCALRGSAGANPSADTCSAALFMGASPYSPNVEISESLIEGARISTSKAGISYGLSQAGGILYIHNSDISGGEVASNTNATCHALHASGGQLLVSSSRIWGGYANALASVVSLGVLYASSSSNRSVIANSLISGGMGIGSTAAESEGVMMTAGTLSLAGDCIDAGTGANTNYAVNAAGGDSFSRFSCIFSTPKTVTTVVAVGTNSSASRDCYNVGSNVSGSLAASPSLAYEAYADSVLVAPGGYFAAWLAANNWKLRSGVTVSATSTDTASEAGFPLMSATWPALFLDRDGKERTGGWTPGMYQ